MTASVADAERVEKQRLRRRARRERPDRRPGRSGRSGSAKPLVAVELAKISTGRNLRPGRILTATQPELEVNPTAVLVEAALRRAARARGQSVLGEAFARAIGQEEVDGGRRG